MDKSVDICALFLANLLLTIDFLKISLALCPDPDTSLVIGSVVLSQTKENEMTQNAQTASRVFLSDEAGLQIVGFGADRQAAVRDGLDRLQKIVGDRYDYSEFRTFDIFPVWQINPHAFFAVECNHSDIGDDGYQIPFGGTPDEDTFETHPESQPFVVLIDSMSGREAA